MEKKPQPYKYNWYLNSLIQEENNRKVVYAFILSSKQISEYSVEEIL